MSGAAEYRHPATVRAVLRSLVEVICPPEAAALGDAIVAHMEPICGSMPPVLRAGLRIAAIAYDTGAVPRFGRRARALRGDRAERYFAAWERGPTVVQREFARGVKQLMCLACYEQPAMMEQLGYRPAPWIAEVTQRRLTVFRDDALRQAAQVLSPDPLRPGVRIKRDRA